MSVCILRQISVEHEVVVLTVYWNLVYDLVLVVVKEVFKDLLIFRPVVSVSHYSLSAELLLILVEERLVDDFVHDIRVFCVFDLLIDLSEPATLEKLAEHCIWSEFQQFNEVFLCSTLYAF